MVVFEHTPRVDAYNMYSTPRLFLPGFEPGTFCVLGKRDDHYTTETPLFYSTMDGKTSMGKD